MAKRKTEKYPLVVRTADGHVLAYGVFEAYDDADDAELAQRAIDHLISALKEMQAAGNPPPSAKTGKDSQTAATTEPVEDTH